MSISKIPTREEIQSVIDANDPSSFLGFEETAFFEVRERAYSIDATDNIAKEKAKQSLVTDITSIANSGGGFLLIGLTTSQNPGQPTEYVSSICGVKQGLISVDKWRIAIREHTTPRLTLEAINHGFIGKDTLVFWMQIPNAKDTGEYPILVTKAKWPVDNSTQLKGELYGLFHRDGAENLLESPDKIQRILAAGLSKKENQADIAVAQYQRLSEQLDSLNNMLESKSAGAIVVNEIANSLSEATSKLSTEQGYFYIYARPREPMQFARFWDNDASDESTVYGMMKNPPRIRNMGWGLEVATSEYPHPNGNGWEITNGTRKILQVTTSGSIFAAISIEDILNWGEPASSSEADILVNELSLTEYIYNYVSFVNNLIRGHRKNHDFDLVYGFNLPSGAVVRLLRPRVIMLIAYEADGRLGDTTTWHGELYMGIPPAKQAADIILNIIRAGFGISDNPPFIAKDQSGYLVVNVNFYRNIR